MPTLASWYIRNASDCAVITPLHVADALAQIYSRLWAIIREVGEGIENVTFLINSKNWSVHPNCNYSHVHG